MSLLQNARLCHKCDEQFVGNLCPKCTPIEVLRGKRPAATPADLDKLFGTDAQLRAEISASAPPAPAKPARGMSAPNLNKTEQRRIHALKISGQVHGGKNGMGINHATGRHYARPKFKLWRDDAVAQIKRALPFNWQPIATPVNVRLDYVAGDRRRRDFPAICDALWHVLERAGVVTDDALLWPSQSTRSYDKSNPGVTITFL